MSKIKEVYKMKREDEIKDLEHMINVVLETGLLTEVIYEYGKVLQRLGEETDVLAAFSVAMVELDV